MTHFHHNGLSTAVGSAYISQQDKFTYLVIDDSGKLRAKPDLVREIQKKLQSSSGNDEKYVRCGAVWNCSGKKSQVCVMKISNNGKVLPVPQNVNVPLSNAQHSVSVIYELSSGNFHMMESSGLYNALTGLKGNEGVRPGSESKVKSYLEKRSTDVRCARIQQFNRETDETCDFDFQALSTKSFGSTENIEQGQGMKKVKTHVTQ